jgi:hypothetical protein
MALVIAMVFLAMLAFLGSAALLTSSTEMDIAGNERTYQMAFYAADAGTEICVRVIEDAVDDLGQGDPSYSGSGVTLTSGFSDSIWIDDDNDPWTSSDIQIAAGPNLLGDDMEVRMAVDRNFNWAPTSIGTQIPEPGDVTSGAGVAFYNFYFDIASLSRGPRNSSSRINSTFKCALYGACR